MNAASRSITNTTKYDITGNLTIDEKFRGLRYRYDANGRMWKSANVDNTAPATSVYDGLGQRVQTTDSNNTKTLVYDAFGRLVSEYDTQSQTGTGGTKYVMSDVQGSARVLTDSSGAPIARHDYQAFGGEIGATIGLRTTDQKYNASDSTRQRYALTERDSTGLDHTDWRKYDNSAGRWTTPDLLEGAVGNPQSFNRYSYALNDPMNLVDPSGLHWEAVHCYGVTYENREGGGFTTVQTCDLVWVPDGPFGGGAGEPGGSGGAASQNTTQNQSFLDRLKKCVHDIYGVELINFVAVTNENKLGTFQGSGYDRYNFRTGFIQVLTEASAFSSSELAEMNNDYARRYPDKRQPFVRPGQRALGATFSFGIARFIQVSPHVNYLANDPPPSFSSDAALLALQVHELGHSLADITGKGKGERGKQLEDCVFPKTSTFSSPRRR